MSIPSISSPGGRFNMARNLAVTHCVNEIDAAESIINSSVASKSTSVTKF